MKIRGPVDTDFHKTSKEHVLFCESRFTRAVRGPTPLQLYLAVCEGTICSSSQEGQVRITGVPPQGPITAPDAKVS